MKVFPQLEEYGFTLDSTPGAGLINIFVTPPDKWSISHDQSTGEQRIKDPDGNLRFILRGESFRVGEHHD